MTHQIHPQDQSDDWRPFPEDIISGAILWTSLALIRQLRQTSSDHAAYAGHAPIEVARIASRLTSACDLVASIVERPGASPDKAASIMALGPNAWISALNAAGSVLGLKRAVVLAAAARHEQRERGEVSQ